MAGQYRIQRKVATSLVVTENGVATIDMPRGYDYESIGIRIRATVVLTAAGAAVRALAPHQLIKRVELVADGKNTIASVPFWELCRNPHRPQYGLMTPPSGFAIATYSGVEAFGILDQAFVDGVRPKDSNLRTSGMALLQLRLTLGAAIDLFTGTPAGSITVGTFLVDVFTVETVELPDKDTKEVSSPAYLRKRSFQDIALPASNANQQVILPVGNALRSVKLLATINGEPSNAVLNNAQLASGVDVRVNLDAATLQRKNAMDFSPPGIVSNSSAPNVSFQMPTGLYIIDMCRNGEAPAKASDAWDLTKASEAKLILDVVGGAGYQLTAITEEFIG